MINVKEIMPTDINELRLKVARAVFHADPNDRTQMIACDGTCPRCTSAGTARKAAKSAAKSAWLRGQPVIVPKRDQLVSLTHRQPVPFDEWIGDRPTVVIPIAEGVQVARDQEGNVRFNKNGTPMTRTVNFRSDAAVTARAIGNMKRWSAARVRGSTSSSSDWAVPARPADDRMGRSDQVERDLQSVSFQAARTNRPANRRRRKGKGYLTTEQLVAMNARPVRT